MGRARANGLAVGVAVALHAVVLGVLAIGPRVTPPVELPTMQVTLAPPLRKPPPPSLPKPPKPAPRHLEAPPPSQVAPLPVPPPPQAAVDDRWRVHAAPYGGDEVLNAIRRNRRCLDDEKLTDWERSKCPVAKPPRPDEATLGRPIDRGGAFAKAAEDKARQRRYRDTYSDKTYPGLHCLFGRC